MSEPDIWRTSELERNLADRAALLAAIREAGEALAAARSVVELEHFAADPDRPDTASDRPDLQAAWRELLMATRRAREILDRAVDCGAKGEDDR